MSNRKSRSTSRKQPGRKERSPAWWSLYHNAQTVGLDPAMWVDRARQENLWRAFEQWDHPRHLH